MIFKLTLLPIIPRIFVEHNPVVGKSITSPLPILLEPIGSVATSLTAHTLAHGPFELFLTLESI